MYSCFAVAQRPPLKKRYRHRAEKVKEYLESVKDIDKLISPQSLFLHYLGPKPSTKVRRNFEVVRKSTCFYVLLSFLLLFFFFFLLLLRPFRNDD